MIQVPKFKGLDAINVFNKQGKTNYAEAHIKFQQDVKHLLETPRGSVLGNLDYGSNLYRYLYLPVKQSTGTMIQEEIRNVIESNYEDIIIDTVDVVLGSKTIEVSIGYNNGNSNVIDYINLDFESGGEMNG